MSQQPRKKRARKVAMFEESMPTAVSGEPLGDHRGYLAIGLATAVVAIVGMIVVMVALAAT